ncbi:hypothetical protein ACFL04_00450 [Patescibacteria group bacterium]
MQKESSTKKKKKKNMDQKPITAIRIDTSTGITQKVMVIAIMLVGLSAGVGVTYGLVSLMSKTTVTQQTPYWPVEPLYPADIVNARTYTPVDPTGPEIYIHFVRSDSINEEYPIQHFLSDYLGFLEVKANIYNQWFYWDTPGDHPLKLILENTDKNVTVQMPARTIVIEYSNTDGGDPKFNYLCIPRTNIPPESIKSFYFDVEGKTRPTPLHDVDDRDQDGNLWEFNGGAFYCNQQRIPLTFETLNNASAPRVRAVNEPVSEFDREGQNYGDLQMAINRFTKATPPGTPADTAPLRIEVTRGVMPPSSTPKFPQTDVTVNVRQDNLNKDDYITQNYTLCIPQTNMPSPTFNYWYDVFGEAYRDDSLGSRALCCRNSPCGSKLEFHSESADDY